MLHVILLILKIIGITLAVILGIVILLLCIILFVPIRYKLTGNVEGDIKKGQVAFRLNWLFHLLSAKVDYQERKWNWKVRIAWIRLGNQKVKAGKKRIKKKPKWQEQKAKSEQKKSISLSDAQTKDVEAEKEDIQISEAQIKEVEIEDVQISDTQIKDAEIEDVQIKGVQEKNSEAVQTENTLQQSREEKERVDAKKRKTKSKGNFIQKIREVFQKIKYTIKNIYDKIREINNKKEVVMKFLRQEVHKRALQRLKEEGVRFLKRVIPKKCVADIVVGFEDPSTTGQFLAWYSVVFPFLPERVTIRPDFERAVFEGGMMLKGHIRMVWLVAFIWKVVWDKDVRETYYDTKRLNFKEEV